MAERHVQDMHLHATAHRSGTTPTCELENEVVNHPHDRQEEWKEEEKESVVVRCENSNNNELYVHDQLPNVEDVRLHAASTLSMANSANRATTVALYDTAGHHHHGRRRRCGCGGCFGCSATTRGGRISPKVWNWVCWVALILMVLATVVLIVGIIRNQNSTTTSIGTTAESRAAMDDFLVSQGVATYDELNDDQSAQWDAVSWLLQLDDDVGDDTGREPIPSSGEETAYFLQRYVLVLLFYSTEGQFWTHSRNLLRKDRKTCDWNVQVYDDKGKLYTFGAVCTDPTRSRIVTKLHLPYNNIKGRLPKELGYLTNLEYLALHTNALEGSLPSELRMLTNLKDVALHENELTGPIPSWIDQWSNLKTLGLSSNLFHGTLPSAMYKLKLLETLGLDENSLEGDLMHLESILKMKNLYLSGNAFGASLDAPHLWGMRDLEELDMSNNMFTGSIPSVFFGFENLRVLDLQSNWLNGDLPSGPYTTARSLVVLSLGDNNITGSLADGIIDLTNLEQLDLSGNLLSGNVPDAIGDLTALKFLSLADNLLSVSKWKPGISSLTNLQDLSLKNCLITGPIPTLSDLDQLVMMDLGGNDFEGNIPQEWGQLSNLKYLILNQNEGINGTVPESIQRLPSLKMLILGRTSIEGNLTALCERHLSNLPRIERATADCGNDNTTNGDDESVVEVECNCCTSCCVDGVDGVDAPDDDSWQECSGSIYLYVDPIWQNAFEREKYSFTTVNATTAPGGGGGGE